MSHRRRLTLPSPFYREFFFEIFPNPDAPRLRRPRLISSSLMILNTFGPSVGLLLLVQHAPARGVPSDRNGGQAACTLV